MLVLAKHNNLKYMHVYSALCAGVKCKKYIGKQKIISDVFWFHQTRFPEITGQTYQKYNCHPPAVFRMRTSYRSVTDYQSA